MVVAELRRAGAGSVLDFGCGTGCYSFFASRDSGVKVLGYDVDASRAEQARRIAATLGRRNLDFQCGAEEAFWTSQTAAQWDVVLAVEVLTLVTNLDATLRQIQRCLRPGGRFLCHVQAGGTMEHYDRRRFDQDSLRTALLRHGLEPIEVRPTFGRSFQILCAGFGLLSKNRAIAALSFPFFLLLSQFLSSRCEQGIGMFVSARLRADDGEKPL